LLFQSYSFCPKIFHYSVTTVPKFKLEKGKKTLVTTSQHEHQTNLLNTCS
jgi:hypothetical protein